MRTGYPPGSHLRAPHTPHRWLRRLPDLPATVERDARDSRQSSQNLRTSNLRALVSCCSARSSTAGRVCGWQEYVQWVVHRNPPCSGADERSGLPNPNLTTYILPFAHFLTRGRKVCKSGNDRIQDCPGVPPAPEGVVCTTKHPPALHRTHQSTLCPQHAWCQNLHCKR